MKIIALLLLLVSTSYAERYYFGGIISFDNKALRDTVYNYVVQYSSPCIQVTPEIRKYDYITVTTTPAHYDLEMRNLRFNETERFFRKLTDYAEGIKGNSHIIRGFINTFVCQCYLGGRDYGYTEIWRK